MDEVKTLRATVGELEAYCLELEEQIGHLERQLDDANAVLGEKEGEHGRRTHEDSMRLQMLLEEHDAALRESAALQSSYAALIETNDQLASANAALSEQMRRLREERRGAVASALPAAASVGGRPLSKLAAADGPGGTPWGHSSCSAGAAAAVLPPPPSHQQPAALAPPLRPAGGADLAAGSVPSAAAAIASARAAEQQQQQRGGPPHAPRISPALAMAFAAPQHGQCTPHATLPTPAAWSAHAQSAGAALTSGGAALTSGGAALPPGGAALPPGAALASAVSAQAASEAELSARLSELEELARRDHERVASRLLTGTGGTLEDESLRRCETARKDAIEDERARLTRAAPTASVGMAAMLAGGASHGGCGGAGGSPAAAVCAAPTAAATGEHGAAHHAGSHARSALHTHASLGAGRLGDLQRITDAIRAGRPLHEVVDGPSGTQQPWQQPTAGGDAANAAAPLGAAGGEVDEAAAAERLRRLSSRPLGQRTRHGGAGGGLQHAAGPGQEDDTASLLAAAAGVGGAYPADFIEGGGEWGEGADSEAGDEAAGLPGDEDGNDDDSSSGGDDNTYGDEDDGDGDDDDADGRWASAAAGRPLQPHPSRFAAASSSARRGKREVSGSATGGGGGGGRGASRAHVQRALAGREGKQLLPSALAGMARADGGDGRVVSVVAKGKPSRLRALLAQEMACQSAVSASLAGA